MSKIPLFGGAREFAAYERQIMEAIRAVLVTGEVVGGQPVTALERRMAAMTGRRQGIAVNSGTDALLFALLAAGVGAGDEVLVTDFSFVASASAIALTGATPVFVDVDATYNMDLDHAERCVTDRTRAIVFVHLYGQMSDPSRVEAFARRHNLLLIEDAAQSIGAEFNGRPVGSLGLLSCMSFNSTKPIAAPGGGGIVLTDGDELAERVRRLRYHGKGQSGQFVELGYNSLMPTVTAAALNIKLDYNAEWLAQRREVARRYVERLSGVDDLILPDETPGAIHVYHKFVVRTPRRDALKAHLASLGVETKVHYPLPLHREPCFAPYINSAAGYVNADRFAQTVLSLPIYPFLSAGEIETITDGIREFSVKESVA